jgi:hypothetical protein
MSGIYPLQNVSELTGSDPLPPPTPLPFCEGNYRLSCSDKYRRMSKI